MKKMKMVFICMGIILIISACENKAEIMTIDENGQKIEIKIDKDQAEDLAEDIKDIVVENVADLEDNIKISMDDFEMNMDGFEMNMENFEGSMEEFGEMLEDNAEKLEEVLEANGENIDKVFNNMGDHISKGLDNMENQLEMKFEEIEDDYEIIKGNDGKYYLVEDGKAIKLKLNDEIIEAFDEQNEDNNLEIDLDDQDQITISFDNEKDKLEVVDNDDIIIKTGMILGYDDGDTAVVVIDGESMNLDLTSKAAKQMKELGSDNWSNLEIKYSNNQILEIKEK